jgi:hypothetical protein
MCTFEQVEEYIPDGSMLDYLIKNGEKKVKVDKIKNQLSRQTGSRNLTGPKMLPTIWYTYMTLVTKKPVIGADMPNFMIRHMILGRNFVCFLFSWRIQNFYTPAPRRERGYTVLPLSVRLSMPYHKVRHVCTNYRLFIKLTSMDHPTLFTQ